MAFQSTVSINQAFGVVGELIQDEPIRAETLLIGTGGFTVGYAGCKSNSTNVATMGGTVGTGVLFAGILINPKNYASGGTTSGPLAPTLTLPANSQGEFLTFGTVVVAITGAANIGDQVQYNTTTGALSCVAPGAAASGGNALIPNATVYRFPTAASGLVAIRLTGTN